MAYKRLPDNLPQILRSHGLKVTVLPGWKTRGRPETTGGFDPVGVLCHHTATAVTWTIAAVLRLLTGGRTGLPGPLAQIGLGRKGRVYIIAAGRANHAGWARSSGSVAEGDGNELYIGIEAFNDGVGEKWPSAQYKAYVLLCAVLSVFVTENSVNTVRGHKETSTTGKIDPTFEMDHFRTQVAHKIRQLEAEKKSPTKTTVKPKRKTVNRVAREVIAGKWGNGVVRKRRLKRAGYSYVDVQARVMQLLKRKPKPRKSINEVAREVIAGKWGNGPDRTHRLRRAGYKPKVVQNEVNRLLK